MKSADVGRLADDRSLHRVDQLRARGIGRHVKHRIEREALKDVMVKARARGTETASAGMFENVKPARTLPPRPA